MSRLKRLAHSLLSGYIVIGANVIYTLASVPLANHYLSRAEFGLWALMASIGQYIMLIDLGMTGTSRILIDYKDQRDGGGYGSVIQTFFLVSLVQGVLVLAIGTGLAWGLVPVLHIPEAQQQQFTILMIGQCVLVAGGFLTRIVMFVLIAHNRYDLSNYAQAGGFAFSLAALWLAFKLDQGVYSTLFSQAALWLSGAIVMAVFMLRLHLLPARHCWGHPSWSRFRELFKLGSDLFVYSLGTQILAYSQTLMLTRVIGLEASAVWSVCTRAYTMVSQLIYRVLDFSLTSLAEMMVRGERELLLRRFRGIVVSTASLSVLAGTIFAVCNQTFVSLWLGGKYSWTPLNDVLLAVLLLIQSVARCHLGLAGTTKDFRSMRFIYLLEASFFVGLALWLLRHGRITSMLACSIAGASLFSSPYGSWRTSRYFEIPWRVPAVEWWLPPFRLATGLVPMAALVWWLGQHLTLRPQLLLCGVITSLAGVLLLLRLGIEADLRAELLGRAPVTARPLLRVLTGAGE